MYQANKQRSSCTHTQKEIQNLSHFVNVIVNKFENCVIPIDRTSLLNDLLAQKYDYLDYIAELYSPYIEISEAQAIDECFEEIFPQITTGDLWLNKLEFLPLNTVIGIYNRYTNVRINVFARPPKKTEIDQNEEVEYVYIARRGIFTCSIEPYTFDY